MSKFKDTAPTKVLGGGKKTKKMSGGNETTAKNSSETVNLRQEDGAMGGMNVQFPKGENKTTPVKMPEKPEGNTVHFRPKKNKSTADNAQQTSIIDQDEVVEKPVTGWLVITKGKGKGQAIPLSYGLLKIGRDASQDVALNFGDEGISRINHASIEFDKKTRKFYLGKGENQVNVNGVRVGIGGEKELTSGDEIEVGDETVLRFIAFCGPDFDWNED